MDLEEASAHIESAYSAQEMSREDAIERIEELESMDRLLICYSLLVNAGCPPLADSNNGAFRDSSFMGTHSNANFVAKTVASSKPWDIRIISAIKR